MGESIWVPVLLVIWLVMLGMAVWGLPAILYSPGKHTFRRVIAALIYGLIAISALVTINRLSVAVFIAAFVVLIFWWRTIKPSNDRDWQPDVAVLAMADVKGDLVTVHNVRNLNYRSETDFTLRYYDKTYDLRQLTSVDLISVYWMGPAIAHVFVSFVFEDRDYLAISIELRKKRGDVYSALKGLFKQYELCYVVADERDVIRLRTNFRKPEELTYLYRTHITRDDARNLFLAYIKRINHLAKHPRFYNTLASNCTTNILLHTRGFRTRVPFSWKVMLSGYVDSFAYDLGGLDDSIPFEELKRRSLINARAQMAGDAEDFSQRIRRGLPMMPDDM